MKFIKKEQSKSKPIVLTQHHTYILWTKNQVTVSPNHFDAIDAVNGPYAKFHLEYSAKPKDLMERHRASLWHVVRLYM